MATVGDYFTIGSTVSCTTCFKQSVEGEVLAFDPLTKMLILKSSPGSNSTNLNDIFVVNLTLCGDVQVKREVERVPDPPQTLNIQRLATRARNAHEQKKRWIAAKKAGVSVEGQKLYMAISKTITHIGWRGSNIVVFNDVTIKPPYKLEDVVQNHGQHGQQLTYVKKIVEKFLKDQAGEESTSTSTTTTTIADSTTSTSTTPTNLNSKE